MEMESSNVVDSGGGGVKAKEPRSVLGSGRKKTNAGSLAMCSALDAKKDREPRNVLGPGGVKGKELRNLVSPGGCR